MQNFKHPELGEIRRIEIDGEPWLVGKDVATTPGYKDTVNALKSHVDSEDKRGWKIAPRRIARSDNHQRERSLLADFFQQTSERQTG